MVAGLRYLIFYSLVALSLCVATGYPLSQFVTFCADHYLSSEHKEVRLEAVKTCSHLLTPSLAVSCPNVVLLYIFDEVWLFLINFRLRLVNREPFQFNTLVTFTFTVISFSRVVLIPNTLL